MESWRGDVAQLMERVSRWHGGKTWADCSFLPALEALAGAVREEARLDARGWRLVEADWARLLGSRLARQQAPPPAWNGAEVLFLSGPPRTGSTLLHNLLAQVPGTRTLRAWEALFPVPPPQGAPDPRPSLAALHLAAAGQLAPGAAAAHALRVQQAEECGWLFQHGFLDLVFLLHFHVPGYLAHYAAAPHGSSYQEFRNWLAGLEAGASPARRWVLKSPRHLSHWREAAAAFPGARVVRLRRDTAEVAPSLVFFAWKVRRLFSSDAAAEDVLRDWLPVLRETEARADAASRELPAGRLLEVEFNEVRADPVGVARRIHEWAGWAWDAGVEAPLRQWAAAHAGSFRAARPSDGDWAAFGWSPREIRRRLGL